MIQGSKQTKIKLISRKNWKKKKNDVQRKHLIGARCEFLDNKVCVGAMLMDLSKVLNHELLIAKLLAYGFDIKLVHSYLTKRWQKTKVRSSFSTWSELLQGVPQGFVLESILFNIYLRDLFWLNKMARVCNFADDTTFYVCDKDLNILINILRTWYCTNYWVVWE